MDNLFTPEVIEQFIALLETAAEGGVQAVILWLLIPLLVIIVSASAWLYGFIYITKQIKEMWIKHCDSIVRKQELEQESKSKPTEYKIGDRVINEDTSMLLRSFLHSISDSSYIHESHVNKLIKAWRSYEG